MDLKELRSFLAIAEEESMTKAAIKLHISQPSLSRQMKSLEASLGKRLFVRESFGLHLTEEGRLLKERAKDLVAMAERIEEEFTDLDRVLGGTIRFGLAESKQIGHLAAEIASLKKSCPDLHCKIESGVTEQVLDRLDQGILDFAVLMGKPSEPRLASLAFPEADLWGAIMREDCDLAEKESIAYEDLVGRPLFCSEQSWKHDIPRWCGSERMGSLRLESTFGLAYNGSLFAKEGLGILLALEGIVHAEPGEGIVFRPLEPPLKTRPYLVWRKNRSLSPIARRFLEQTSRSFGSAHLSHS